MVMVVVVLLLVCLVCANELTNQPTGGVLVFWKDDTGAWSGSTLIQPPATDYPGSNTAFGTSVSLSGDGRLLAVGAPDATTGGKEGRKAHHTKAIVKRR